MGNFIINIFLISGIVLLLTYMGVFIKETYHTVKTESIWHKLFWVGVLIFIISILCIMSLIFINHISK